MLSARTQKNLSGYGDIGVGLPPASPSDREIVQADENSTLFLLAGYARYNSPYVWVRSNHERLVKYLGSGDGDKDNPLKLRTTRQWQDQDVKVWQILGELVKLCTYPPPINPFAVDFEYFENLPLSEKLISTAAMINFLQKVILHDKEDKSYTAKVLEDLQELTRIHLTDFNTFATEGNIPALVQQTNTRGQLHSSRRGQHRMSAGSYYHTPSPPQHYSYSHQT